MEYRGIQAADLAEVVALNRAVLRLLRSDDGQDPRAHLSDRLQARIVALTDWQIERLSRVPVLLGINTADNAFWDHWFDGAPQSPMFEGAPAASAQSVGGDVAVATLVFLWQLTRVNPYAARLVSGASVNWCERLADCRLAWLVRRTRAEPGILLPRRATQPAFWEHLLNAGVSTSRSVRDAAHLSAMQTVLTIPEPRVVDRFRPAARRQQLPTLQRVHSD